MISGQDLLVGKHAVQIGLLRPTLLNDVLSLQQVSAGYRSLTEILDAEQLIDEQTMAELRTLRSRLRKPDRNAAARLSDYRNLIFGTAAATHGYCTDEDLQRSLAVLEQAERELPVNLGHVMVALRMLTPEQVEQVRALQQSDAAYCASCDTILTRKEGETEAQGGLGATCPACGSALIGDQEQTSMPSSRLKFVDDEESSSGSSGRRASTDLASFSEDSFTIPGEIDKAAPHDNNNETEDDDDTTLSQRGSTTRNLLPTSTYLLGESDLEDAVRAAGQSEYLRRISTRRVRSNDRNAARAVPLEESVGTEEPAIVGPFDDIDPQAKPRKRRDSAGGADAAEPIHWRRPSGSPSESTLRVVEIDQRHIDEPGNEVVRATTVDHGRAEAPTTTEDDAVAGAGAEIGVQLGEYVVLSELGRGGMGVVYLARKIDETKPRYAIKFIRKDLSRNATYVRRFEREIKLVLSLNHPNIVATREYGQRDGYWYLVMEYVHGENLGDVLEREKRLSVNRAVSIIRQTALALASAHEQGIVHRDMKPDNVILSRTGEGNVPAQFGGGETVKITDFGLAKEMAGLDDTLTITGQLIGTPHYMSPEQCRGDYSDQRSDIYSLGCAFYHMLTGRPPFLGDNYLSVMEQQKNEPITPPHMINPSVPLSLSFIVGKMMEKNANDRYPTMELLISHLDMWDSNKLVDEVARYAPAFSRVRTAFGRSEEFSGANAAGGPFGERLEKELRTARETADWLRHKVSRLERLLARTRSQQAYIILFAILTTLLGLIVGYLIGGN